MKARELFENDIFPANAIAISLVRALGDIMQEINNRGGTKVECNMRLRDGRPVIFFLFYIKTTFDEDRTIKSFISSTMKAYKIPYTWTIVEHTRHKHDENRKNYGWAVIEITPNAQYIDFGAVASAAAKLNISVLIDER